MRTDVLNEQTSTGRVSSQVIAPIVSPLRRLKIGLFGALFICLLIALIEVNIASAQSAKADDENSEEPSRYAPGSKGVVEGLDIGGLIDRARRQGKTLESGLPHDTPDLNWDPSAAASANSASPEQMRQIEEMLGLKKGSASLPSSARKTGSRVLIFATFGMPDASLKALVHDAMTAEATVVFQGFVDNSIPKTGEAVRRIFGDEAEIGMAIDPTAFSRFNVTAAPVIIALAEPLISCKTRHCAEDITPPHDRITGNATLEFALNAIVERGDAGVFSAGVALDRLKEAQK